METKLVEKIFFKTGAKIKDLILIVMETATHEKQLTPITSFFIETSKLQ